MNQKIVDYLQENKESYSKDSLVEQLRNAGYSNIDILEATKSVYSTIEIPLPEKKMVSINDEKDLNDGLYADFWIRVGAALIDGIITFLALGFIMRIIGIGSLLDLSSAKAWSSFSVVFVSTFVVILVYRVAMVHVYQATVGKLVFSIKVCNADDCEKLSFKDVFLREFIGVLINKVYLFIIHVMVSFTEKKQSVHDLASHAVVVYKNKS
jgi:uncharacterized RDD family membrane protein YckC